MKAFTLIECLIYIGLFGCMMAGAVAAVSAAEESSRRNEERAFLEIEGNFVLEKIAYDIEHAVSASISSALPSDKLILISDSGSTIEIYENGNAVLRTEDGISEAISDESSTTPFKITQLTFTSIPSSFENAAPEALRSTFRISTTLNAGTQLSRDFSSVVYLFP